jgi:hypothetical protein
MASDPILLSWTPITAGKVFHNNYAAQSGGEWPGLGVMASLDANAIWRGYCILPDPLPSGTATLDTWLRANATSGVARINPKWVCGTAGTDIGSAAVVAETVASVTWSSGDANDLKLHSVALDASTLTAGYIFKLDLTFETSSWTLAQTLWAFPVIRWV